MNTNKMATNLTKGWFEIISMDSTFDNDDSLQDIFRTTSVSDLLNLACYAALYNAYPLIKRPLEKSSHSNKSKRQRLDASKSYQAKGAVGRFAVVSDIDEDDDRHSERGHIIVEHEKKSA